MTDEKSGRFAPFSEEEKAALAIGLAHLATSLADTPEYLANAPALLAERLAMIARMMNELGHYFDAAIPEEVMRGLAIMAAEGAREVKH